MPRRSSTPRRAGWPVEERRTASSTTTPARRSTVWPSSTGWSRRDEGREILRRLWKKIDEVGFTRFDLGVPLVARARVPRRLPAAQRHRMPEAGGRPDTFGQYMNGGITAGQVLHFLAAHYVVGEPERADRVLRAMLERQRQAASRTA